MVGPGGDGPHQHRAEKSGAVKSDNNVESIRETIATQRPHSDGTNVKFDQATAKLTDLALKAAEAQEKGIWPEIVRSGCRSCAAGAMAGPWAATEA